MSQTAIEAGQLDRQQARLPYKVFDADNHYYESEDALTRHLPKEWSKRGPRWVKVDGRDRLLLGERLYRFVQYPTFSLVARPGSMHDFFHQDGPGKRSAKDMVRDALEPLRPEYRDRDKRLKVMDEQGVGATWLFPSLAAGLEVAFQPDIPAALATFRAFNRWLNEDWGFHYRERIFAAPYLSLSDPDWAVEELEWCLKEGARVITMRNGPLFTETGARSPADPIYDPFWARCEEAGIVVAPHAGDDGYDFISDLWEPDGSFDVVGNSPVRKAVTSQRAAPDFFAVLVCHKLFERFPNLKVASVENGAFWLGPLFGRLKRGWVQSPGWYKTDPIEQFQRNIWVTPFWEDKVEEVAEYLPIDKIIFGSDWPHMEGVAQPLDFLDSLGGFSDEQVRRIMRENVSNLTPGAQL